MNLYVVLSEEWEKGGYYSEPEHGRICEIVRASSPGQARYYAMLYHRRVSNVQHPVMDWLKCSVRKIGTLDGSVPGVIEKPGADMWLEVDALKPPLVAPDATP